MRLGFAVAINVDPDVLLVDEVLAVGDEAFTHKCLDKFAEFRRRGKTILLVTHSLNLVERFCDDVLWLDSAARPRRGRPAAHRVGVPQRHRADRGSGADRGRPEEGEGGGAGSQPPVMASSSRASDARGSARAIRPAPARRPPTCSRRPRAAGARARSRSPNVAIVGDDGERRHIFQSGEAVDVRVHRARIEADEGLRVRRRHVQRGRRLLLRHQHLPRGTGTGRASPARAT